MKNFKYYIDLSAKNNIGIEELFTILLTLIDDKNCELDPPDLIACNARQVKLLEQGKDIISDILENIKNEIEMDIIASQCREFIDVTEELLGKVTTNEVLNGIFKGFCVGK
jgi:tRNA modification GTPase